MIASCPICGSPRLKPSVSTPRLRVSRCQVCGHRIASHLTPPQATVDYHEQYDQGGFLASLASTRQRQAGIIIDLIRRQVPDADRLLDFGAGRGWFLEACRASGIQSLAGVDTSEVAVGSLKERQFAALTLTPAIDYSEPLGRLPFRPRILTLLDVVEHFYPDQVQPLLGSILRSLQPELELVVIKVPDAGGLLYRGARSLARIGLAGPIEQLYQIGTDPPHFSYFTRGSMRRLLEPKGLTITATQGDRDFEAGSLADRVRALAHLPAISALVGSGAAAFVNVTGWYDSTIFLAIPR